MGPPAGIWLKESPTIMKNESWSISEPAGGRYIDLSGKPWKQGSSSEIILQNRSSDSLPVSHWPGSTGGATILLCPELLHWLNTPQPPNISSTSSQKLTAQRSQNLCNAISSLRPGESCYGWFCASSHPPFIEDRAVFWKRSWIQCEDNGKK